MKYSYKIDSLVTDIPYARVDIKMKGISSREPRKPSKIEAGVDFRLLLSVLIIKCELLR